MPDELRDRIGQAHRHLATLMQREPTALIELRFRRPDGAMRQRFYPVRRTRQAAQTAVHLARSHDVYVGVTPRRRRAGGRAAIDQTWTLWADCDTPTAAAAIARFQPAPSLTVRSGTDENRHAYWPLAEPIAPAEAEQLNRRLARTLGADEHTHDAARVLRVAGTSNHKHQPPTAVALEHATGQLHQAATLTDALADVDIEQPPRRAGRGQPGRQDGQDPLLTIAPAVYVHALTGLTPDRDGKVSCPFHRDRTPSLHVYPDPDQGWHCYGCQRGGSIYDLAAYLWDREPRGRGFLALRHDLHELLDTRP